MNILDIKENDENIFPEAVSNAIIRAWAKSGTDENNRPVKSAKVRQKPVIQVSAEEEKFIELGR